MAQGCSPERAVLCHLVPAAKFDACCAQRLAYSLSVGHQRTTNGTGRGDPAGEEFAGEALRRHPSDMTQPAELAMGDVATDGLEVKAVEEVLIADVPVAGVPAVDTTHRSDPIHVETMNTGEEHFGKGPGFTAVEQDVEYKAGVDGVFGGVANFSGVEDALLEVTELLCSALEALVYVNIIAPISGDPTAQVLE